MRAVLRSNFVPAAEVTSAKAVSAQLASIACFTLLILVASLPALSPTVLGSELRFVSIPLALLSLALMLRPRSEAAIYIAIYATVALGFEARSPHFGFASARIAIEILQTLAQVSLLYGIFLRRFTYPIWVGLYAMAIIGLTAVGASLMLAAADLYPLSRADYFAELGGNAGLAWRTWWLGNACSYLAVAGPIATVVSLRSRILARFGDRTERGQFLALTAGLIVAMVVAFPVYDNSWIGLPPDVQLAKKLIPVPIALAMAARFRANGAAVALLIFAGIATLSITGPSAPLNWQGVPMQVTPVQSLLLMTTVACMVLSGISRQLQRALREAVEASEVKSRFIGLMSHELRTPLNAILGFSELMRMQSLRELGDEVATLDNIHASGQRLLAMIDALLSHAGDGETIFELRKELLHLGSAVEGALADIADELSASDCAIETDIPNGLFLEADPRALRQILNVLLGHSLRVCAKGGAVRIAAFHEATDTIIEIRSKDSGPAAGDDRDKVESHLVNALVLAHGARLTMRTTRPSERSARLRFFATRAAV